MQLFDSRAGIGAVPFLRAVVSRRGRAVAGTVLALLAGLQAAHADIRDTRHNLSGQGQTRADPGDREARIRAEREVCVFCHTPNASELAPDSAAVDAGRRLPKWQRSIEVTFSFEMFDDIGRAGADGGPTSPVGSVSFACLSCHDGAQAFSVLPGSRSDHPIGVPYRGFQRGGQRLQEYRQNLLRAQDSPLTIDGTTGDDEFRPARSATVNRRQLWWASVANVEQRTKNDLPLYSRRVVEGAGNYETVPFIECTSCHDPHSTREVFLRTSNEGSRLCLTCHVK